MPYRSTQSALQAALKISPKPQSTLHAAFVNFDSYAESMHVRAPVVAALYGCSVSTVWRMAKRGTIPRPYKLSAKITGWNVGELRRALTIPGVL